MATNLAVVSTQRGPPAGEAIGFGLLPDCEDRKASLSGGMCSGRHIGNPEAHSAEFLRRVAPCVTLVQTAQTPERPRRHGERVRRDNPGDGHSHRQPSCRSRDCS